MHEYLVLAKDFIGSLGFPIFVATLLLYRVEAWHVQNINAMNELRATILDRHLKLHCEGARPRPRRPRRVTRSKDKPR